MTVMEAATTRKKRRRQLGPASQIFLRRSSSYLTCASVSYRTTTRLSCIECKHCEMQSVRQIQRLNDAELEKCVPPSASWHTDYRDTAYVHVGGLPFELSEGDVLTIFSQYGNPVHVNLVRDKETGKSRGFAFLKYEDQRSCDLAVDNLSGAGVLGRVLSVDHARYKLKEGEIEGEGMNEEDDTQDEATDTDGEGRRKRRRSDEANSHSDRPALKEELELAKMLRDHDDDDPMKAYLLKEKREQIAEALKDLSTQKESAKHTNKDHGRRRRRRRRESSETDPSPRRTSRSEKRREPDQRHVKELSHSDSHPSGRHHRRRSSSVDSGEPHRMRQQRRTS